MTTKFLDTQFALSKFSCHGVSQEKNNFLDDFPLCPMPTPPPRKAQILFLLSSRRL